MVTVGSFASDFVVVAVRVCRGLMAAASRLKLQYEEAHGVAVRQRGQETV